MGNISWRVSTRAFILPYRRKQQATSPVATHNNPCSNSSSHQQGRSTFHTTAAFMSWAPVHAQCSYSSCGVLLPARQMQLTINPVGMKLFRHWLTSAGLPPRKVLLSIRWSLRRSGTEDIGRFRSTWGVPPASRSSIGTSDQWALSEHSINRGHCIQVRPLLQTQISPERRPMLSSVPSNFLTCCLLRGGSLLDSLTLRTETMSLQNLGSRSQYKTAAYPRRQNCT
jgi:hypothetical protein